KYDLAERYYKILLNELPLNHPHVSSVYSNIALIYQNKYNMQMAMTYHNLSLDKHTSESTIDPCLYSNIATSYYIHGDYNQVILYTVKALNELEHMPLQLGHNRILFSFLYHNLAMFYCKIDDIENTLEYVNKLSNLCRGIPSYFPKISA
ncbi:unnamed protein product, partial [Didymodactylos carnosus]